MKVYLVTHQNGDVTAVYSSREAAQTHCDDVAAQSRTEWAPYFVVEQPVRDR